MNRKMNVAAKGMCCAPCCAMPYASDAHMGRPSPRRKDCCCPCCKPSQAAAPPPPPPKPSPCADGATLKAGTVCENNPFPFIAEESSRECEMPLMGCVCVCEMRPERERRLAQISFPIQKYVEGFCPDAAIAQGTLFPELAL